MDWVTIGLKNLYRNHPRSNILLCSLLSFFVAFWSGCSQARPPDNVIGAWTSNDKRFEGRVLKITPTAVEITVDGESVAFYIIAGSQAIHEKGWLKVMLNLEDLQQNRSNMLFNYNSQRDTLWLENRPDVIWHRAQKDASIV